MKAICPFVLLTVSIPTTIFAQPPVPERQTGAKTLLETPFTKAQIVAARSLWSKAFGGQKERTSPTTGIKLKLIPPGAFPMGSTTGQADERPVSRIEISNPIFVSETEVTMGQFRKFVEQTGYPTYNNVKMSRQGMIFWHPRRNSYGTSVPEDYPFGYPRWTHPGYPVTENHPVTYVNWNDAMRFCRWLSETEGRYYRLPTEEEWEYLYRAGTETEYPTGSSPEGLTEYGNIADATAKVRVKTTPEFLKRWSFVSSDDGHFTPAPVKSFKPNPFGLYDLCGNVGEMCASVYRERRYDQNPRKYYTGRLDAWWITGSDASPVYDEAWGWHARRGSDFETGPARGLLRSAARHKLQNFWSDYATGFRIVEVVDPVGVFEKPKLKLEHEVLSSDLVKREVTYTTTLENVSKRTLFDVRIRGDRPAGMHGILPDPVKIDIDDATTVIDLVNATTNRGLKIDIEELKSGGSVTITHTARLRPSARGLFSEVHALGYLQPLERLKQRTNDEVRRKATVFISNTALTTYLELAVLLRINGEPDPTPRGYRGTRVTVSRDGTRLGTVEGFGGELLVNGLKIDEDNEMTFTVEVDPTSLSGKNPKCIADPDGTLDGRYTVTLSPRRLKPTPFKFVYSTDEYIPQRRRR